MILCIDHCASLQQQLSSLPVPLLHCHMQSCYTLKALEGLERKTLREEPLTCETALSRTGLRVHETDHDMPDQAWLAYNLTSGQSDKKTAIAHCIDLHKGQASRMVPVQ